MKEKPLTHRCVEKGILDINSLPQEDLKNFTRSKVLEVLDRKKVLQLNLSSCNETFKNLKITRFLGLISDVPKLPKFQS